MQLLSDFRAYTLMSSHDGQSNSTQWTEPPWSGWIETTGDALLILEAARRGLIPRVTRRLVDSERKMITSGSVFVFDEDESGIKRWTDGFFWSPSRILGNFLLYRETEKRGAGHRSARAEAAANVEEDSVKQEGQTLSRPKSEANRLGINRDRERILVGSLTNSYKFKPGGMMKKVCQCPLVYPSSLSLSVSSLLHTPLSLSYASCSTIRRTGRVAISVPHAMTPNLSIVRMCSGLYASRSVHVPLLASDWLPLCSMRSPVS